MCGPTTTYFAPYYPTLCRHYSIRKLAHKEKQYEHYGTKIKIDILTPAGLMPSASRCEMGETHGDREGVGALSGTFPVPQFISASLSTRLAHPPSMQPGSLPPHHHRHPPPQPQTILASTCASFSPLDRYFLWQRRHRPREAGQPGYPSFRP